MNDALHNLIEALREELREYGGMLALLEQQQEQVVGRAADELLQTVTAVNRQGDVLQRARQERERRRRELCAALAIPLDTPLKDLSAHLPENYRPLVQALLEENNALLARVQQRARQNFLLLRRSLELVRNLIATLCPALRATTYAGDGGMRTSWAAGQSLYDAVG
jgi:flagellar biosynthesis/type III secretory pathway chaperone